MSFYAPKKPLYVSDPGIFLPDPISNLDLLKKFGFTEGVSTREAWITARTGINNRYWASENQSCSDLAVKACENLFEKFPDFRDEVKQIILATISGDFVSPPTSPLIQHQLNLNAGCYDLGAACAAFATALLPAAAQCEVLDETHLLICADIRSKYLNPKDLLTAILFGDGAAACLVSQKKFSSGFKLLGLVNRASGAEHSMISIPAGGSRQRHSDDSADHFIQMKDGPGLFLKALDAMKETAEILLSKLGLTSDDIKWFAPHQANLHLIREVQRRLGFTDKQTLEIVSSTGNVSGVSSVLALNELLQNHSPQSGDRVLNVSAGGGGFAAAAVLEVL